MKEYGIIIIIIGFLILALGFTMDTSVSTESYLVERVYNLGLMQNQSNLITLSGILIISGVLLFGFGNISNKLDNKFNDLVEDTTKKDLAKAITAKTDAKPEKINL